MKKFSTLLLILFGLATSVFGQKDLPAPTVKASEPTNNVAERRLAAEGTFILVPKSKDLELFTTESMIELRVLVEQRRRTSQRTTISFSGYTDILIFSKDEIDNPSFRPAVTLYEQSWNN